MRSRPPKTTRSCPQGDERAVRAIDKSGEPLQAVATTDQLVCQIAWMLRAALIPKSSNISLTENLIEGVSEENNEFAHASRSQQVAVLVKAGFNPLTLGGLCEVLAAKELEGFYTIDMISPLGGIVGGSGGLEIMTRAPADVRSRRHDVVLIVGGHTVADAGADRDDEWVDEIAKGCGRIYAFGHGVQIAFERGLLGGAAREGAVERFAESSRNELRVAERYGHVLVSPGSCAAVDVALIIVEEDFNLSTALLLAETLHMPGRRKADEASVGRTMALQLKAGTRFTKLLQDVRSRLDCKLNVEILADWCSMSPRTFTRHFTRETGVTPAAAITAIRLDLAISLLNQGGMTMKEVASTSGFGSELKLRRALARRQAARPLPAGAARAQQSRS